MHTIARERERERERNHNHNHYIITPCIPRSLAPQQSLCTFYTNFLSLSFSRENWNSIENSFTENTVLILNGTTTIALLLLRFFLIPFPFLRSNYKFYVLQSSKFKHSSITFFICSITLHFHSTKIPCSSIFIVGCLNYIWTWS
jgi:hypothetical protein